MISDSFENSEKQRDVFYDQGLISNIDSIKYIKWMLDEKEDARAEYFLGSSGKDERE